MCAPGLSANSKQSSGPMLNKGSAGYRFDIGQRLAAANAGGGTTGAGTNTGTTILTGTPKNVGVNALRKTTMMRV